MELPNHNLRQALITAIENTIDDVTIRNVASEDTANHISVFLDSLSDINLSGFLTDTGIELIKSAIYTDTQTNILDFLLALEINLELISIPKQTKMNLLSAGGGFLTNTILNKELTVSYAPKHKYANTSEVNTNDINFMFVLYVLRVYILNAKTRVINKVKN